MFMQGVINYIDLGDRHSCIDEDEEGLKKVQVEKKRKVIIREGEMRFVCIDKFILSID